VITLTTDFGLRDPYVAEMKGVILTINPKAQIIDNSHGVEKYNTRVGAFMLASILPYFPKGTVHVAVIDPQVGTKRRAILIETIQGFFVGPDNGVLMLAAKSQVIQHVYEIVNPKLMLTNISNTFQGRDIFAPAAAHLTLGIKPEDFGPEVFDPMTPEFVQVDQREVAVLGEILDVDDFGNVVTNIQTKEVCQTQRLSVKFNNINLELELAKTYAHAKFKEPLALIGSNGFLELAINQGSFSEKYHISPGDKVQVIVI